MNATTTVSRAIVPTAEQRSRHRVVLLGHALLDEVADHHQEDQVERLHRRQLAPPDDPRQQIDEEERDGCADDEVHQGKIVTVRSISSNGVSPS